MKGRHHMKVKTIAANSKKLLSVLLALMIAVTCIPFTAIAVAADETAGESTLQNFWHLLNDETVTDIKVAYLGGSITNGSNASPIDQYSWRGRVGQWLVDNYGPGTSYNKNIENINSGIGATGSYFGAYRLYDDAKFAEGAPDLLFIEFGVNDIYDGLKESKHEVELNYESIIRQAYKANPKMTVVTVFTMDNNIAANIIRDGNDTTGSYFFRAQRNVADYYGLPQMNVGMNFVNEYIKAPHEAAGTSFSASSYSSDPLWTKYIADACHPNNDGHAIYAGYITDYFAEQLGDTVGHTAEAKTVNIDEVTPYVASFGDGAENHLKENGRSISFKDAGFTQDDLNGWTLVTTDSESSKSSSNGLIRTTRANASFAFKFTGTSVGFYNQGMPSSGTLNYTITSTADPSEKYTGSVSLIKTYQSGLPYPAELMTGLENKEWLVECVLVQGDAGCYGELRYIYINGDPASVSPAEAPVTQLQKLAPIFVDYTSSTHLANAENNSKFGEVKKIDNITGKAVLKGDTTARVILENYSYSSLANKITFPDYTHVGVTYYLDDNGVADSNVQKIAFVMCQYKHPTGSSGWVVGSNGFPGIKSAPAVKGKWVTQYFDFTDFATLAAQKNPGSYLYQAKPYPYGDIPASNIQDEIFYFNGTVFSGGAPLIYNADGTPSLINDGNQIAYVSSTGEVTLDGKTYEAYISISEAVNALSPIGGTIRVSGSAAWTEGAAARGKITIEGIDSDSLLTNTYLTVKNGDLELKNIKMTGHSDEYWSSTNGHKLILGEGFNSGAGIRPAASADGNPTNADIYSGKIGDFAAIAGYNRKLAVNGNSEYNIYGGNISGIAGISRNGLDSANYQTFNGNITYNFYGGNISSVRTSNNTGVLNGNIYFNVNGGKFTGSMVFGGTQGAAKVGKSEINGNAVYIINNKELKAAGGSLSGVILGKTQNPVGGVHNKIIIVNNNELSADTGAKIAGDASAEYQLLVNGGKAKPVISADNTLKGFELTSDYAGRKPRVDGSYIEAGSDGLYVLEAAAGVTRIIDFADENSLEITFSDGASASFTMAASKNEIFKLPAATFSKEGFAFAGWKTEGDETVYLPGAEYSVGEAPVTFVAQWKTVSKVYVKYSAGSTGTGISADSPVKTINEAIVIGGKTRDFEIIILDEYIMTSYFNHTAHTGTITFTSEDGNGVLTYPDQFAPGGPCIIKNIKLRPTNNNNFMELKGASLTIGEGVTLYDSTLPQVHLGKNNTDTPYQYGEFSSGSFAQVYVGSYYNSSSTPKKADGAKITVNGANISKVWFGPDGYGSFIGPVTWTNSPSLVLNSGKVGYIGKTGRTVVYEKPVQIILNGGTELPNIDLGSPAPEMIIIRTSGAISADATETSGVFKIDTELEYFLIDGVVTQKNADGLYTLGVGEHVISDLSVSGGYYVDIGGKPVKVSDSFTVTASEEGTVNFNTYPAPEKTGELFLGWYNADGSAVADGSIIAKDAVITAKYQKFVTDVDSAELGFGVLGAQIRLSGDPAFRFVNKMSLDIRNVLTEIDADLIPASASDTGIGYGFVVLPEKFMPVSGELKKDTERSAVVPAVKIFDEKDGYITYTACLTNVTGANYAENYTVRPYITYNDAQGIEHTVYGEQYAANMAEIAALALENEGASLSDEQKAALSVIAGK